LTLCWVGFVLVGLACKNAILIVEFARQQMLSGKRRIEAAAEAARLRLRPILMTSLAFILGALPLVIAKGAGAEMDQAVAERSNPRAAFDGYALDTPWDWLDLAYFYGYAISNYLTTPFLVRAAGLPVGGAGALAGGRPDLAPAQGDVPLL
jgi:hypothetical protein